MPKNGNCCSPQVVPVFAGGLDFSLPVRKFFYDPLGSGKAFVDCVVSLTGFALVGGPARQDAPKVHPSAAQTCSVPHCPHAPAQLRMRVAATFVM